MCLDIHRWALEYKEEAGRMLTEIAERVSAGEYGELPTSTFPISEVAAALKHLSTGKQIGKVVVEVPGEGSVPVLAPDTLLVDPAATYLITGGCSGFGLALAGRLVARGARHLVLVGRRGLPGETESGFVDTTRGLGTGIASIG